MNILFICSMNKRRSRTAEYIFKNDNRFNVRSAGLSKNSERKVNEKDINWADKILVMEKKHRSKLFELNLINSSEKIEILNIPDIYEYMDEELIDLLKISVNEYFE